MYGKYYGGGYLIMITACYGRILYYTSLYGNVLHWKDKEITDTYGDSLRRGYTFYRHIVLFHE